jgi:hypothetical protein
MSMKHLEHMKHTLATCMYMQHPDLLLQHSNETIEPTSDTDETFETYTYA